LKNSQCISHTHLQFAIANAQAKIAKEYVLPTLKAERKIKNEITTMCMKHSFFAAGATQKTMLPNRLIQCCSCVVGLYLTNLNDNPSISFTFLKHGRCTRNSNYGRRSVVRYGRYTSYLHQDHSPLAARKN